LHFGPIENDSGTDCQSTATDDSSDCTRKAIPPQRDRDRVPRQKTISPHPNRICDAEARYRVSPDPCDTPLARSRPCSDGRPGEIPDRRNPHPHFKSKAPYHGKPPLRDRVLVERIEGEETAGAMEKIDAATASLPFGETQLQDHREAAHERPIAGGAVFHAGDITGPARP